MFASLLSQRSGSYQVTSPSAVTALDEARRGPQPKPQPHPTPQPQDNYKQTKEQQADFNQNNSNQLNKLRTLSFSRLISTKCAHQNKYNIRAKTTNLNDSTTTTTTKRKDGVTLCTLGVGTTFGASVMPGKSHSVSVVTNEECTLLRVRRADFQEIFNESTLDQSGGRSTSDSAHAANFSSLTSLNRSSLHTIGQLAGDHQGRHLMMSLRPVKKALNFGRQRQQPPPAEARPTGTRRSSVAVPAVSFVGQAGQTSGSSSASQTARRQSIAVGPSGRPIGQVVRSQRAHAEQQSPAEPTDGDGEKDNTTKTDEGSPDQQQQQQEERHQLEEELNNLDSLDSNELSSQLMRVGWVLRTLMLSQWPQMIQNRRVYPHLQGLRHSQASARKSLAGAPKPSVINGASKTGAADSPGLGSSIGSSLGKSAASLAGRKVANYVASSFMRGSSQSGQLNNNSTQQKQQPFHPLIQPFNRIASSLNQFSNSFDTNTNNNSNQNAISDPSEANNPSGLRSNPNKLSDRFSHCSIDQTSSSSFGASDEAQTAAGGSRHQPERSVLIKKCLLGREMVDWLLQLSQTNSNSARFVTSRLLAISMWQVLLEQGIVFSCDKPVLGWGARQPTTTTTSGSDHLDDQKEAQFCDDREAHYKFWFDRDENDNAEREGVPGGGGQEREKEKDILADQVRRPSEADVDLASDSLWWSLKLLSKLAPDACFRLILSKAPHERSAEEVDIVFEELQHLKALSHLTNSVKKELAACVLSEHHPRQNTVVFNQGDVGHSWYIILRGSVNVVIVGKGVVCTLHDGDDFGKLALVNDAPRAATIVTNEPNCYFLRVDKHNFNTILRDVEANTVRLKEHGKEVLILQKVATKEPTSDHHHHQAQSDAGYLSTSSGAAALSGGQPQANGLQASQGVGQMTTTSLGVGATTTGVGGGGGGSGAPTGGLSATPANGPQSVGGAATAPTPATPASNHLQQQQPTSALKYMVMAGTGEKMLEHLLETRIDGHTQIGPLLTGKSGLFQHDQVANYIQCHGDNFLEDFILTHRIFMPTGNLCQELLKHYQSNQAKLADKMLLAKQREQHQQQHQHQQQQNQTGQVTANNLDEEYLVAKKRRVAKFVRFWMLITREHFFQQQQIQSFLTTLHQKVKLDALRFPSLQPELNAITRIYELHLEENLESRHRGVQRWIDDIYGNILPIRRLTGAWQAPSTAHDVGGPLTDINGPNHLRQQAVGANKQQAANCSEQFLASLHLRRFEHKLSTIQPEDELVFRVYCADHSYTTLKTRFDEQAGQIKQLAARNLKLDDKELILVHVKSNGERMIYNDLETNISTCLSANGRLFVCPLDHIDAISPLPEQDPFQEVYQSLSSSISSQQNNNNNSSSLSDHTGDNKPIVGSNLISSQQQQQQQLQLQQQLFAANEQASAVSSHLLSSTPINYSDIKLQMGLSVTKLEEFSSRDIAYCLTQLAWSLLKNMHEFELIYTVFGRHNFKQITANLNVFLRHFNEIQYWVVTQICLSSSLSKRVQILRKFIKIAAHCKELQNLNAFFAIIMGLSNMAVARLTQTWERLPSKLKRTFSQFESQIDPSRNHRRYRIFMSKLEPPIIPFMPLFLKDMTFAHEGNKTHLENGLINFEKMQMVAQTLRTLRYCKSRAMKLDSSACKFKGSIRSIELFFRDLKIIDNQRTLTQMSHQLEHRKT